jgi:glucose uptake protein GlcU
MGKSVFPKWQKTISKLLGARCLMLVEVGITMQFEEEED